MFENHIILLMGFPGVGKYTTAKEIVSRFENFRLVDNHLINDPLFYVAGEIKGDIPRLFWNSAGQIREAVFTVIREMGAKELTYVMTGFLCDDENDRAWFERTKELCADRGGVFVPIALDCEREENKKRASSEERQKSFKLADTDILEKYLDEETIYNPDHPNFLKIDVTTLNPNEVVDRIIDHIKSLQK
tara:strand:- start:995 stop:1564 length:570 start_codon:yes stop_codon:yes gene_type:complete